MGVWDPFCRAAVQASQLSDELVGLLLDTGRLQEACEALEVSRQLGSRACGTIKVHQTHDADSVFASRGCIGPQVFCAAPQLNLRP